MRFFSATILGAAVAGALLFTGPVEAGSQTVIKMATIAPKGSKAHRILRAWDKTVQKRTSKQVKFRFYPGGIAGDERDVIRKMRVGQMDATTLTSVGLGQIVRSATVLQLPGLFRSYKELGAVRSAMGTEWNKQFQASGYQLLGWFDIGFGHIYSKKPIAKPTDLKRVRPWVWKDDPVYPELMRVVGANGVPLALPEVFPALQTGMVDTVVASPLAALGLQWFRKMKYVTKQSDVALVGATLITKKQFDTLPPDVREVLLETGKKAHAKALQLVERENREAQETLLSRGIKQVDMTPHKPAWDQSYSELTKRLTGKLFTGDLLQRVEAAAQQARK